MMNKILRGKFVRMRESSKKNGKHVPSCEELHQMYEALHNMECPNCKNKMGLSLKKDGKNCLTLQHNMDGSVQFLCLSCNSRHRAYPEDSFYNIPKNHKICPACKKIKPFSEFYKNKGNCLGYEAYCKPCKDKQNGKNIKNKKAYNKLYREKHREEARIYGKKHYQQKKKGIKSKISFIVNSDTL